MGCETCKHVELQEMGADLKRPLICKRMPPIPVIMPTPQGVALTTMFPQVVKEMSCSEHAVDIAKTN